VWGITYGELKGLKWLLSHRLDRHPQHVRFRTMRRRYATSAWVTIDELAREGAWADIHARVKNRPNIVATTSGVSAMSFARDDRLVDPSAPITVTVDGVALEF